MNLFFCDAVAVKLAVGGGADGSPVVHSPDQLAPHVAALPELRQLVVANGETADNANGQMTDGALSHVAALRKLQNLTIVDGSKITDAGVAKLGSLTRLVSFRLTDAPLTDESLRILSGLPSLEELIVGRGARWQIGRGGRARHSARSAPRSAISDRGMLYLSGMPRLSVLDIAGAQVTSAGIKHLHGLKLRSLVLSDNRGITDDAIDTLCGLQTLEELFLDGTLITSCGVERLTALVNLSVLDLSGTLAVTDDALRHIGGLSKLVQLHLNSGFVTCEGLEHLKRLKALRFLSLSGTGADSSALERALPTCDVFPGSRIEEEIKLWVLLDGAAGVRRLIERMIELCEVRGLDRACVMQKPELEELLKKLKPSLGEADVAPERLYDEVKTVAAPADWASRLRIAAGDLELVDRLTELAARRTVSTDSYGAKTYLDDACDRLRLGDKRR